MAESTKRVIWKGAISFGLVHIPIALHTATAEHHLDFNWLDKRTMDPVGYKRINKRTGKEIDSKDIVKGLQYEKGEYVVLSAEEIAGAYPKTTQTIEIEAFVKVADIPFFYLDRPYYVSPINKSAKVYALLREVLLKTGKAGVAKVVIQTRQHLALLVPVGAALMLELLRWEDEIRVLEELDLPPAGLKATKLTGAEMDMAEKLVDDMSEAWKPQKFSDTFKEQILKLVGEKVKEGDTATVAPVEEAPAAGAKIYDLTEILRRSLHKGAKPASSDTAKPARNKAASPTSAKAHATRKPASTRTAGARHKKT
ncbi:MAG TPA: Ku protein [Burkholderiaceae bacterium]|jgi:DNA end-binding protein Ku